MLLPETVIPLPAVSAVAVRDTGDVEVDGELIIIDVPAFNTSDVVVDTPPVFPDIVIEPMLLRVLACNVYSRSNLRRVHGSNGNRAAIGAYIIGGR